MPCKKCPNGKYRFGRSDCKYTSLAKCRSVEKAYHASGGFKRKVKSKRK